MNDPVTMLHSKAEAVNHTAGSAVGKRHFTLNLQQDSYSRVIQFVTVVFFSCKTWSSVDFTTPVLKEDGQSVKCKGKKTNAIICKYHKPIFYSQVNIENM